MPAPAIRFSSRVVIALALTGAGRLNYPQDSGGRDFDMDTHHRS
jgi:hypothetical protein